jgi:hypothetical protein
MGTWNNTLVTNIYEDSPRLTHRGRFLLEVQNLSMCLSHVFEEGRTRGMGYGFLNTPPHLSTYPRATCNFWRDSYHAKLSIRRNTCLSLLIILLQVWSVAVAKYVFVHQKCAFIRLRLTRNVFFGQDKSVRAMVRPGG